MPVRPLPAHPSLDHLKHQAKDLIRLHAARDPMIAQKIREFHPRWNGSTDDAIFAITPKLSDAQLTIARESGFASWARLKAHIESPAKANRRDLPHHERIEDPVFRKAVETIDTGDAAGLRNLLASYPGLSKRRVLFEGTNYFRDPSLLEFVAENPIRRGRMPANIVEVARAILDAGVEQRSLDDALGLVASGSVARVCRMQEPLIDLLANAGADLTQAAHTATLHGETGALQALIRRGARVDLAVAAALNDVSTFARLLPKASAEQRHLALAIGAHYGFVEVVRMLLDAGEDPNRYNPVGGHSHGTPLHEAAGFGHLELVRLLVERGARLDQKDVLWGATPLGWAEHEGRTQAAEFLRSRGARRA